MLFGTYWFEVCKCPLDVEKFLYIDKVLEIFIRGDIGEGYIRWIRLLEGGSVIYDRF
jgi:hypothetical protein